MIDLCRFCNIFYRLDDDFCVLRRFASLESSDSLPLSLPLLLLPLLLLTLQLRLLLLLKLLSLSLPDDEDPLEEDDDE